MKYKTSTLVRIFTLGIKQYGFIIDKNILIINNLFQKEIPIEEIKSIFFELKSVGKGKSYFYVLTDTKGKVYLLPYSLLEGETYKSLFKDLLKVNPRIILSEELKNFLNSEVPEKILKLDFKVYKGEFFKKDRELTQKHPSLDAFIGFTIVFIIFPIPFIFGIIGNNILIENFGENYETYRIWSIVISGIGLTIAIINVFIALVSMYLGHRLTFISLIICIIGLVIGFGT